MGKGNVDCSGPVRHRNAAADQRIEQGLYPGTDAAHVGPNRFPRRNRRWGDPPCTESEHGPRGIARAQFGQRPAAHVDRIHHDRGNGFSGGSFESWLPPGVDLNNIEQRANDSIDGRQPLRAGASTSLIESQGQRFCPGGPRVLLRIELAADLLSLVQPTLRREPSRFCGRQLVPERFLRPAGLGHLGCQPLGVGGQAHQLLFQVVEPPLGAGNLRTAAVDGGAHRGQLTAHLCRRAGGGGHSFGPLGLEVLSGNGEVCLRAGQFFGRRGEVGAQCVDVDQFLGQPGRLGLQVGGHVLVDERPPIALDPPAAFGQDRRQATGFLAKRLEPDERVAQIVSTHGRQAGLRSDDVGIQVP